MKLFKNQKGVKFLKLPSFYRNIGVFFFSINTVLLYFAIKHYWVQPKPGDLKEIIILIIMGVGILPVIFFNFIFQYAYNDSFLYTKELFRKQAYFLGDIEGFRRNTLGEYEILLKNKTIFSISGRVRGFREFWNFLNHKYQDKYRVQIYIKDLDGQITEQDMKIFIETFDKFLSHFKEGFVQIVNLDKLNKTWLILITFDKEQIEQLNKFFIDKSKKFPFLKDVHIKI